MTAPCAILLIEDHVSDSDRIQYLLRTGGDEVFELTTVQTLHDGLNQVSSRPFDAVLLDLSLPDSHGLQSVHEMRHACPDIPLVVLTGLDDREMAIASLNHGVQDYLAKDKVDTELLVRALRYSIERNRIVQESKKTAEALRRAERLASLGTFAAGISHEINNPIVAAWTSAAAALNYLDDPDGRKKLEECLHNVISSVQRCRDTIENILSLARHGDVERCPFDLSECLDRAIEETQHYADKHKMRIERRGDQELASVLGSRIQIAQVIVSVLRNAIEASGEGDTIEVVSSAASDRVKIAVVDEGHGIAAEIQPRVFDPFFTICKENGTGLGLSIANTIMEGHGGTIDITSREGHGTTVSISFPVGDERLQSSKDANHLQGH